MRYIGLNTKNEMLFKDSFHRTFIKRGQRYILIEDHSRWENRLTNEVYVSLRHAMHCIIEDFIKIPSCRTIKIFNIARRSKLYPSAIYSSRYLRYTTSKWELFKNLVASVFAAPPDYSRARLKSNPVSENISTASTSNGELEYIDVEEDW